jgi:hypothetical protein
MALENNKHILIVQVATLVCVLHAYFVSRLRMAQRARPQITYGPMRETKRLANLNQIYDCNDIECVDMLRMRAPFFHLCELLRSRNLLRDSIHSMVEEQVSMFLPVVGHNQ